MNRTCGAFTTTVPFEIQAENRQTGHVNCAFQHSLSTSAPGRQAQMQPTSQPSSLTGTSHVHSTPPYATKQLDDTVKTSNPAAQPTAEFPPPSSLTVSGSSPATRAQVDCNHWSQQLPALASKLNVQRYCNIRRIYTDAYTDADAKGAKVRKKPVSPNTSGTRLPRCSAQDGGQCTCRVQSR